MYNMLRVNNQVIDLYSTLRTFEPSPINHSSFIAVPFDAGRVNLESRGLARLTSRLKVEMEDEMAQWGYRFQWLSPAFVDCVL
ncbi:uncharacterized protein JCM10292_004770 [Rhodotorula paludigena]|uniref:uncharacterized protein n=1 Tax=Rhodotorula paludigena TaxID=86838 RepID=UPI00317A6234